MIRKYENCDADNRDHASIIGGHDVDRDDDANDDDDDDDDDDERARRRLRRHRVVASADDNNTSSSSSSSPPHSSSSSPSAEAVRIMNVTSGLCADPVHYHSFAALSLHTTPRSIFVSAFRRCAICDERLLGRRRSGGVGGGGLPSSSSSSYAYAPPSETTNNNAASPPSSSSGGGIILQCAACAVYAHRTCAFARRSRPPSAGRSRTANSSVTWRSYDDDDCGPPLPRLCEVNMVEIHRAFGITSGVVSSSSRQRTDVESMRPSDDANNRSSSSSSSIFGKGPTSSSNDDADGGTGGVSTMSGGNATRASQQQQSSSMWSVLFGRTRTLMEDDTTKAVQTSDINEEEECEDSPLEDKKEEIKEEKKDPTNTIEENPTQEAGVIESSINLVRSWSIFGKTTSMVEDDTIEALQTSNIINGEECKDGLLEEKKEPTNTIEEKPTQEAGMIESSIKLVKQTTETTKNISRASTIGMVAGGVAGWAIAGPAGVLVGSQIGRNISAVGAVVEGGIGMSVLVMNLANAANLSLRSASEKDRKLKLNSTLVLVRPDIAVEPIWGEYANEARRSWELKHGASAHSSSSGFGLGSLFNTDSSKDERNIRYHKDSDIVKADVSELPTRDKVFLLVNRILNDKLSLPGYQYRYLILKHKRRTMFGDEGSTVEVAEEPSIRSCRQDAHGIIKHVTATLLEVRPGLASSPTMTEMTACAVEILIFGDLYDDVFKEIIQLTEEKDDSLLSKVKTLERKFDDGRTTPVDKSNEASSSVSQSAIAALQSVPQAHTPTDKLSHCVEFLECVSAHFSSTFQGKCIDADTLLLMVCQHVVAANIHHLHAEVAFIEEFSRDEQLLSGKEGYALITLQASLHYLDSVDDLPSDICPTT
jgi:hypothetical protein